MPAKDLRSRVLRGATSRIDILADAVKVTLGPKVQWSCSTRAMARLGSLKDGVTVAKEIALRDKFEIRRHNCSAPSPPKTHDHAGDGTTTATVTRPRPSSGRG